MIVDRAIHGRGHTLGGNQDDHSDVSITSAVQGDILSYNATAGTWDNGKTITANLATTAITINQQGAGDIQRWQQGGNTKMFLPNSGVLHIGQSNENSQTLGLFVTATAPVSPAQNEYVTYFNITFPADYNQATNIEAANFFNATINAEMDAVRNIGGSAGQVSISGDAGCTGLLSRIFGTVGTIYGSSSNPSTGTFTCVTAVGAQGQVFGTFGSNNTFTEVIGVKGNIGSISNATVTNAYSGLFTYPSAGTNKWAVKAEGFTEIECANANDRPNLCLDQKNVDQDFIIFEGTSAADETKSISTDTAGPYTKKVRVKISGDATQYWLHLFADHT